MSPDKRQHRGPHPADSSLFGPDRVTVLRQATFDLSWLLTRGYSVKASVKIVGDRYHLTERQCLAVSRAACADASRDYRAANCLALRHVENECLIVDGFNLVITVEAALGGGVLILCRDGCVRDLSSVHGSYRSVRETERAILLIGEVLEALRPGSVKWLLDRPVSNSGRLAQRINDLSVDHHWPWSVEVMFNPDKAIISSNQIAVTSDSSILDGPVRWVNFNYHLIVEYLRESWLIDLR